MEKWTSIEIQGERKRIAFFLERNDELCVEDRELLAAFNTIDEKQDEIERLQAELNALKENQWIPVSERLPESGQSVFVACLTEEGRKYTGLAQYFGEKSVLEEDFIDDSCWGEESITEYDEENDCYWVKEGWFEFSLEGERAYRLSDPVIFYMALPELPKEEE